MTDISADAYFHEHLWHIKRTYSTKHSQSVTHATLYQIFGIEWLGHGNLPQSPLIVCTKIFDKHMMSWGFTKERNIKNVKGFVSKN